MTAPTESRPVREIHFHVPGFKRYETSEFQQADRQQFRSISLTGSSCALQCDHCQGQILRGMVPAAGKGRLMEVCRRFAAAGTTGVLVSGGSDRDGRVPLAAYRHELLQLKEELGLNVLVHTGLVDPETAEALAAARVDGALIDVIGSQATAEEVYHLNAPPAAFDRSLALLEEQNVPVLPHIVMGLHYGHFAGEQLALEIVARHRVAGLVLVALMPLVGTPMESIPPPPLAEMAAFMDRARAALPASPLILGCAGPAGEVKVELERSAIDMGLDAIAFPAEATVAYARRKGIQPRFHESCCGLPWLFGGQS